MRPEQLPSIAWDLPVPTGEGAADHRRGHTMAAIARQVFPPDGGAARVLEALRSGHIPASRSGQVPTKEA